jgi:hypothetical protein
MWVTVAKDKFLLPLLNSIFSNLVQRKRTLKQYVHHNETIPDKQ